MGARELRVVGRIGIDIDLGGELRWLWDLCTGSAMEFVTI